MSDRGRRPEVVFRGELEEAQAWAFGVIEGGTVGPARVTLAAAAAGGAQQGAHIQAPITEGSRCTAHSRALGLKTAITHQP